MPELTHLSLFSGIGGLDLAAEWAGFRTVGQCEWADYPHAVLKKHWPDVPKWRDIRTLTGESFYEQTGLRTVTVVSGGFPCQPFSTAGKRRGKEDDRYLWPEMLRVISEIRPTWVVGENVAGLVSMALDTVLSDLENIGYACQAFVIPACAVDAPHRRDRCAIVGYSKHDGLPPTEIPGGVAAAGRNQPQGASTACESPGAGMRGNDEAMAHPNGGTVRHDGDHRRTSDREIHQTIYPGISGGAGEADPHSDSTMRSVPLQAWAGRPGSGDIHRVVSDSNRFRLEKQGLQGCPPKSAMPTTNDGRWPAEPDVGRVAHGVPHRVDKLRCLGNAVVPPQFYPVFQAIADIERSFT